MRLADRLRQLEQSAHAVARELIVIDCDGVPTDAQVIQWETDAARGRRLFIMGPGLDWGWMPGSGLRRPWEPMQ